MKVLPVSDQNDMKGGTALVHVLWAAYIMTCPLYLWSSGLPQVSDFLLALTIVIFWVLPGMPGPFKVRREARILMYFLLLAYCVALTHAVLWTQAVLWDPVRLTYNLLVFGFIAWLAATDMKTFLRWTTIGILLAYLVIIASGLNIGSGRQAGTFNNPNQLAHTSVLCVALLTLAAYHRAVPVLVAAATALFVAYLGLVSISFAAVACLLVGMGVFILLAPHVRMRFSQRRVALAFVLLVTACAGSFVAVGSGKADHTIESMRERLVQPLADRYKYRADRKLDEKIAGFTSGERGLEVFTNYPENILLGAGRGGNRRFGAHNEIHASLPSVLYSYGVLGFMLFCIAFAFTHWRAGFYSLLVALPVWMWSFSHYGLNDPLFWTLFAAFVAHSHRRDSSRKAAARALSAESAPSLTPARANA